MNFGIVVGHNQKAQGATNYLGESEYQFNLRIAAKLFFKLRDRGICSTMLTRPKDKSYSEQVDSVVGQVIKHKLTHTYHLHFNSFQNVAYGCEVLCCTRKDAWIADLITDELNLTYGFKERGNDGVNLVQSGHNGFHMLNELRLVGCHAVIVEPCFGNARHFESRQIFEREDDYVTLLSKCVLHMKDKIQLEG